MTKAQSSTRRSLFVGAAALVAMPLAVPAVAASDAGLIHDVERAIGLKAEICERTFSEDWSDGVIDAHCKVLSDLIDTVCATPAFTSDGLKAKARLLAVDTARSEPSTDQVEILLASLLRDLIGAAAQVPA